MKSAVAWPALAHAILMPPSHGCSVSPSAIMMLHGVVKRFTQEQLPGIAGEPLGSGLAPVQPQYMG